MPKLALSILAFCSLATLASAAHPARSHAKFSYKDKEGKTASVDVADDSAKRLITHPVARIDASLNPKLQRAATIAQERANAHSRSQCWRYVKEALLASGAVNSYPKTALAKEAGGELVRNYGFKKLATRDPYAAPVGAVLVYGASHAPGHVEIRTKTGFVSDFRAKTPSRRPLLGVYAKA